MTLESVSEGSSFEVASSHNSTLPKFQRDAGPHPPQSDSGLPTKKRGTHLQWAHSRHPAGTQLASEPQAEEASSWQLGGTETQQRKIWGSRRIISYVNLVTSILTITVLATAQALTLRTRWSPKAECSSLGHWLHLHQHSSTPPPLGWKTWANTCYRVTELQLLKCDPGTAQFGKCL